MKCLISKYHGAGNDFLVLYTPAIPDLDRFKSAIPDLCHRRFGIGADGVLLVDKMGDEPDHISMLYINSDGSIGTMCGNGARCSVHFGRRMGIIGEEGRLSCLGKSYETKVLEDKRIRVDFPNIPWGVDTPPWGYHIDTGVIHLIVCKDEPEQELDVYRREGRQIRYHEDFAPGGTNPNFVWATDDPNHIKIHTYERGIEDVTYACGTGALASAIGYAVREGRSGRQHIKVESLGGALDIGFHMATDGVEQVYIEGPVQHVFDTLIEL